MPCDWGYGFVSPLPRHRLARSRADEGFSVAVLEALAMGAPVLITKECHFPEAAVAGAALEAEYTPESVILALQSIWGLRDYGLPPDS